jgi:6-phosphogluconolactonase
MIFDDLAALTIAAADIFVRLCLPATERGLFSVALSGGSTPRTLHSLLVTPPYRERIDWSRIEFFWGDERYVPADDPESNYRMARETLLDHVPVPPDHVHPIPTELGDPAATAVAYGAAIRRVLGLSPNELPRLDLIFLGMGPDGHTASLFPHTAALHAHEKLVVANTVPQLHTIRISLTAEAINNAAAVVFLVAGADKADALRAVLQGPRDPDNYPAQLIAPTNGELHWLVDRVAAANLSPDSHPGVGRV